MIPFGKLDAAFLVFLLVAGTFLVFGARRPERLLSDPEGRAFSGAELLALLAGLSLLLFAAAYALASFWLAGPRLG